MAQSNNNTIIVKKIKKGGHAHHGGAWKVAYADFVTAMMAFFLLMWLLNATEAENLAGLADYFAPTVGVNDQMGIGFRGGKGALSDGIGADKNTNKGVVFGGIPTGPITKVTKQIEERTDQSDREQIKIIIDKSSSQAGGGGQGSPDSSNASTSSSSQAQVSNQQEKIESAVQNMIDSRVKSRRWQDGSVEVRRVPQGLAIEIKDLDGNSMFEDGTAQLRPTLKEALTDLSNILINIPNSLAVIGHTSSKPLKGKGRDYGKWELSIDRANATRRFLEKNGIQKEQISRVEGKADNNPYDRRRPETPINDRINIILLNVNDTPNHKKSTPEKLFMNIEKNNEFYKKSVDGEEDNKELENPQKSESDTKEFKRIIDESSGIPVREQ